VIPAVVTEITDLRRRLAAVRAAGRKVGLVPTMGALHAGHASLLALARAETEFVVASVFVNPTQFGPHEDLTRYPRPFCRDLEVCAAQRVDLVFAPAVASVYPPGFRTFVEVTGLQDLWEGASRPGHFRGVATVVLKLFNLIQPDLAFFGQKDAQQVRIIRQLVRDLDVPVTLRVGDTVREPDGLALSSRNQYLDPAQRAAAPVLFQALSAARVRIVAGERDPQALLRLIADMISTAPGAVLDYAAVVDDDTFTPVDRVVGAVLLMLAVRFGTTRLIDNVPVQVAKTRAQSV
jgi:pantoate--beta-alanine ligase